MDLRMQVVSETEVRTEQVGSFSGAVDLLLAKARRNDTACALLEFQSAERRTQSLLLYIHNDPALVAHVIEALESYEEEIPDVPVLAELSPPALQGAAPARAPASEIRPDAPERRILAILPQFPSGITAAHLAVLAVEREPSASFHARIRRLREAEWIEGPSDRLQITQAGYDALGADYPAPVSGPCLFDLWARRLSPNDRAVFSLLYEAHPEPLSEVELAKVLGRGLDIGSSVRRLRVLNLVDGSRDARRASEFLFPAV